MPTVEHIIYVYIINIYIINIYIIYIYIYFIIHTDIYIFMYHIHLPNSLFVFSVCVYMHIHFESSVHVM